MKIAVFLLVGVLLAILAVSSAKTSSFSDEYHGGGSTEQKGGNGDEGNTYFEHKEGKKSDKSSKHDQEKGWYGSEDSDLHRVEDVEKRGKKHKHFHADKHESSHSDGGGGGHGGKYEEGSRRHKGNVKMGFREKFHKDELKKHDSFYSKGEQSGNYNIFGKKGSKYDSQSVAKKAGKNVKNLESGGAHGKSGKKSGGHHRSNKKGHKGAKSSKSNYSHGDSYGRKGGKRGGKQYKYDH